MNEGLAPLFADKTVRCLDRTVALFDGLDEAQAAWAPPLPHANSLAGIANHILANVEENVFGVMAGQPAARDRSAEFAPPSAAAVRERWAELRPRLLAQLASIPQTRLFDHCEHPRRGSISIAEMLMVMLRHAGEHEGEAALTRVLVLSRTIPEGEGAAPGE